MPLRLSLVIAAAVIAAYSNSLSGAFVYDDVPAIVENRSIRQLWPPMWLTVMFNPQAGIDSRPMVGLSLALNYAMTGLEVEGFHATNILIHMACALTYFAFLRHLLRCQTDDERFVTNNAAFFCALIWAVHPLNSQAVNYVIQRSELLMGLFYLLTLRCGLQAMTTDQARWRWAAIGFCALGMGSKEAMASAPIVVLALDRFFFCSSLLQCLRTRVILYVGLAGCWLLLAGLVSRGGHMGTIGFSADTEAWPYALNQADVIVTYLTQSFMPIALIFDYGFPNVGITMSSVAIQLAFVGSATLLAVVSLRRLPGFAFAVFWFCATLATTSSVIPIVNEVGANRRMYLPLLALVSIAAVVIRQLFSRSCEEEIHSGRKWMAGVCGVLMAATLVWLTRSRNEDYRSKIRLWHSAIEVRPANPRAHINLAAALIDDHQLERAKIHIRRAQHIITRWDVAPRQCYAAAYYNMGHVLTKMGDHKAAVVQSQQAVEISPDDAVARYYLGNALRESGKAEASIHHYRSAIRRRPNYPEAHNNLANTYVALGKIDSAISSYRRALQLSPDYAQARYNYATVLQWIGRLDQAADEYELVLRTQPDHAKARSNLEKTLDNLNKQLRD